MKKVNIYTDGCCKKNPGPGGCGIILEYNGKEKIIKEGWKLTTNNRAELSAVIIALKALKEPCEIVLTTDSKYVTDAINKKWLDNWVKKGWRNSTGSLPNKDLWEQLYNLLKIHKVDFVWVKGHNNHPQNERCDALANEVVNEGNLKIDSNYSNLKTGEKKI